MYAKSRGLPDEEGQKRKRTREAINKELDKIRNYVPDVGVFGDSGVGKSTLCNALFGSETAKVSHTSAGTRSVQRIPIEGREGSVGIHLFDVPGVGEDPDRHTEYLKLYKRLVSWESGKVADSHYDDGDMPEKSLDLVIWAIDSSSRSLRSSIEAYNEAIKPSHCPTVFVLTKAEKIEPDEEWDKQNNRPGPTQASHLNQRIIDISGQFDISANKIIAVSAKYKYNLEKLVETIVHTLPNESKFSFTREANDEFVTEETRAEAEEGIWESVKNKFFDVWDFVKDDIFEQVTDGLKKAAPAIVAAAFAWFKRK